MHLVQTRRNFVVGLSTATCLAALPRPLHAEPAPEIRTVRLPKFFPSGCEGPQYIADSLLRSEGFTDVQYFEGDLSVDSSVWLARGETDFDWNYAAIHIVSIDTGAAIRILTGLHSGCLELIANEHIASVNDLKRKRLGVYSLSSAPHILLTLLVAYIGLDPNNDVEWVTNAEKSPKDLFIEGQIDGFLAVPPEPQDLRARGIGHTILATAVDHPWSQYYCCMLAGSAHYVDKYPVATKRVMRALLKAVDFCALNPTAVAQQLADGKYTDNYDYALQTLSEVRYDRWRDFDPEDTVRFYALRLQETSMINSSPNAIIEQGTDWRFLEQLKRELKT